MGVKKEHKETWRELIRKPEGLSWRERRRMWVGLVGGVFIFVSGFFFRDDSAIGGETADLFFGFLVIGVSVLAISVSTFLIYYRKLADKGLFWAGAVNRLGQIGVSLSLLLIYPRERMASGRASFVEGVVICVLLLAYALGFGLIPLVRLIRAYRNRDCEEQRKTKQEGPQKKRSSKFGFWVLGLLLLVAFSICLGMEFQYLKVKAEYEDLQEVRFDQRQETEFDEKRYDEVSDTYHTLRRWVRGGRHSIENLLPFFGLGLLLWILTLMGRIINKAAWRSVERDERREQRKLEKETERRRVKDPWDYNFCF